MRYGAVEGMRTGAAVGAGVTICGAGSALLARAGAAVNMAASAAMPRTARVARARTRCTSMPKRLTFSIDRYDGTHTDALHALYPINVKIAVGSLFPPVVSSRELGAEELAA